ncbi:hypothetical protein HZA43_00070 [Candidatus Peregrinibacteria bacterium]|nr:hypothetical protein [Candidatus Peregrinibacteria bacterium]
MEDGKNIQTGLTYEQAKTLLDQYIKEPANRAHCRESEVVLRGLAKRLGANEEAWGILGLLHDIDWELALKEGVGKHCSLCVEILKNAGMTEEAIQVVQSHGYGVPELAFGDKQRTRLVEYALAAGETITGLIYACALVRPEKKLAAVEASSVKKKFKEKNFAAKVNREIIRECEKMGLTVEEFIGIALEAMKGIAGEIGV